MAFQVRTQSQLQAMFDRALAKSDEQVAAKNLPHLMRAHGDIQTWSVSSRSVAGEKYIVEAHVGHGGPELQCSCPAAGWCWHRTHVERALAGVIDYTVSVEYDREPLQCAGCGLFSSAVLNHPEGLCPLCSARPEPRGCHDCGQVLADDNTSGICPDCELFGAPF